MGRQSARIFFQGKDHKEIYFNGHYHDKMYLTDSVGHAALVWEKIRETVGVSWISMLSHAGGKYYVVVENPVDQQNDSMMYYSRPVLYEGKTLQSMKQVGDIWDQPVRGSSYIMYADPGKLVVIRSRDVEERYIAVIPLDNGVADLKSTIYETGKKDFYISNYKSYVYGGGNNYYETESTLWDPRINKNGITIGYGERVGGIARNLQCSGKIVGVPRRIYASGLDTYLSYFVLDDDNEQLVLHRISLSEQVANVIEQLKESIRKNSNMGNVTIKNITVTADPLPYESNTYIEYVMTGRDEGYLIMFMTVEMEYETLTSKGTVTSGSKGYKMKIHLDNPRMVECQDITVGQYVNMRYNIISQVMDGEYRVQIVVRDVMSTRTCLTYGYVGQDYTSDIQVAVPSVVLDGKALTCIAHCGNELAVGIMPGSLGRFIVIDTTDNTAQYKEINIMEG